MQPPGTDERQRHTDYWLARLRDGDPVQKAEARWQLAAGFEAHGAPAQAVELLVVNAREGFRTPELFEAMSRLYRRLGNEYLATSAAVEATRLRQTAAGSTSAPPPPAAPMHGYPPPPPTSAAPPFAGPTATPPLPTGGGSANPEAGARWRQAYNGPAASRPIPGRPDPPRPGPTSPVGRWTPALRAVGWFVAAATLAGAVVVGGAQPIAGVAYALSAGALALMLAGPSGLRRTLRAPAGPLGDGGLLFAAVLLFLVGGAILPRPAATSPTTPDPVAPSVATPGTLYRGTSTPAPSPAAGQATSGNLIGQRFIVIGNEAGGNLRVSPSSTRGGVLVGDGDVVTAISEDRTVSGILWREVRVSDSDRGWIEVSRLAPAPTDPLPAFQNGQPPAGRACIGAASIKGNINSAGELVYHRTGQEWYYRTFPEVCFRSEADAQAAGFRPSPR